jgi:hypothetical protein
MDMRDSRIGQLFNIVRGNIYAGLGSYSKKVSSLIDMVGRGLVTLIIKNNWHDLLVLLSIVPCFFLTIMFPRVFFVH